MKKIKSLLRKVKPGTGRRRRKLRQISYTFTRFPGLVVILSILLIIGVFLANKWIRSAVEALEPSKTGIAEFIPKVPQHALVPEDPKKYHMQKYKPGDLSLTQQDWNIRISQLAQNLTQAPKTKQEEADIHRRIQALDRQIKYCERMVRRNPSDYKIKEDLQTLYMLRATLSSAK